MTSAAPSRALRPLAADGARLSPIVAGCWRLCDWNLSPRERLYWIEQCLDTGVSSFDHADVYGHYRAEGQFGEALSLGPPSLRARVQIVTKCGIRLTGSARPTHRLKSYDTSAQHIQGSVDNSLRELQVECIELLLLHRPDLLMDPAEVAATLATLRAAGKVRHFGVSNHSASQFELLDRHVRLSTNQVEFSPLCLSALSDGTLDQALDLGRRPMIWSPLAGGRLFNDQGERAAATRQALQAIASDHGLTLAGAAYAWILRHPSQPLPITGTRRIEEIRHALAACDVRISREEWYQVLAASSGEPVP